QVKTTRKLNPVISIKMSNMVHAVKNPLPFFFIVLQLDETNRPIKAVLYHVSTDLIGRTLKKLRILDTSERDNLHKKTLTITNSPDKIQMPCNGNGLKNAILDFTGVDLQKYTSDKLDILKKIGYESDSYVGSFKISSKVGESTPLEKLIELSIGKRTEIEIDAAVLFDQRFGIKSLKPLINMTADADSRISIRISDTGPQSSAILDLEIEGLPTRYQILMDVYVPHGFNFELADEDLKIRLSTKYMEILLNPTGKGVDGEKITYQILEIDEEHLFKDVLPLVQFSHMMVLAKQNNKQIQLKLKHQNEVLLNGQLDPPEDRDGGFLTEIVMETLLTIWTIAKHYDIQDTLRLSDKVIQDNYDKLYLLGSLLKPQDELPLNLKLDMYTKKQIEEHWVVPFGFTTVVGQNYVSILLTLQFDGISGDIAANGHYPTIIENKVVKVEFDKIYDSQNDATSALKSQISLLIAKYQDANNIMLYPDNGHWLMSESLKNL
ncbi:MAG: hypothetical protein V3W14_07820, partial [Candidatus Neomarinimicrobiota bacterium]